MAPGARAVRLGTAFVALVTLTAACSGRDSDTEGFDVRSDVVSDETTQDIQVFAPDAEGPFPVVVAFHGIDGSGEDMAELGTRLAREGLVVFAPTYRTDTTSEQGVKNAQLDAECGYRFARSLAADYGGDLDLPMTFVGWSLGATLALEAGLTETVDASGEPIVCFPAPPRADVVVAVSGCHYEHEGVQYDFDMSGWGNLDTRVVLMAGQRDETCAAWQSEDAAEQMRSAGYAVDLVTLEGANHYAPIFHDVVDGEFVVVPDDPAGERTVEVIVDAVAQRRG
jgi:dienelactone hydrolase